MNADNLRDLCTVFMVRNLLFIVCPKKSEFGIWRNRNLGFIDGLMWMYWKSVQEMKWKRYIILNGKKQAKYDSVLLLNWNRNFNEERRERVNCVLC